MKIHLQQKAIVINGKPADIAVCGQIWPQLTDDKAQVTCKNCLRKVAKLDRLVNASRYSAPSHHEKWEGAEA